MQAIGQASVCLRVCVCLRTYTRRIGRSDPGGSNPIGGGESGSRRGLWDQGEGRYDMRWPLYSCAAHECCHVPVAAETGGGVFDYAAQDHCGAKKQLWPPTGLLPLEVNADAFICKMQESIICILIQSLDSNVSQGGATVGFKPSPKQNAGKKYKYVQ